MICSQCSKEFIPSHHNQKYCTELCFKDNNKKLNKIRTKKYRQSKKGKETKIIYFQTNEGKANKKKASKKFNESDHGKRYRKEYQQSDNGKETKKKYRESNKGKETRSTYRRSEHGKAVEKPLQKKYFQTIKGKEARNRYERKKKKSDPIYKLKHNVRTRLHSFLKSKNMKKEKKTFAMVGCTPKFLKGYLEKQFHRHPDTHQPMNWHNHTVHGWHIDHRIPLDKAKTPEDVEKLMHHTNLAPMWAEYNIKKGNKIN